MGAIWYEVPERGAPTDRTFAPCFSCYQQPADAEGRQATDSRSLLLSVNVLLVCRSTEIEQQVGAANYG
jgi:hypothetical protein